MTIGDPTDRDPSRWRCVTFVHYIPKDEAVKKWGAKKIEPHCRSMYDETNGRSVKMVRLFEYYDIGIAGKDPAYTVIPGEWENEPLERLENPFGCLPFSHYTHFWAPGMQHPVGSVVMQMATQEALNELEEYMRQNILAGKGFDIADADAFDKKDLEAVKNGRPQRLVKRTRPKSGPHDNWERVPPTEISSSALQHLQMLEKQFTVDSGITDFDRGIQPEENRTLGENQLVAERGQTQGSWDVRQVVQFRQRSFDMMVKIGREYDREPVQIDFFDGRALLNNPEEPASALDQVLGEPANAIVSQESLTYRDVEAKRGQRVAQLMAIFPQVKMGFINARWWGEELLRAMGEKDLKLALNVPDEQGVDTMGMNLGAPVEGQVPA